IRAAWGGPIRVTSAYRTPEHNRRIGGARHSQHVQGRALDLQPAIGGTAALLRLKLLVRELIREGHLPWVRGIGYYRTFVHIDTRSSARLVVWHGAGAKDDVRV
ncbi:MAG: D-Ala-D-Ala carboxypeptidase family metallohydrolase, partial [Candidatus Nanopelagicales bacterium]